MNITLFSNLVFNAEPQPALAPAVWQVPRSRRQSFAEFDAAQQSIEQLAFPEANWDGYGALAISAETKSNALSALNNLEGTAPAPEIIPNPNGTLTFEWETNLGVGHLEIGRTRYSFYVRPNVGPPLLCDGEAGDVGRFLGIYVDGLLYPKPLESAYRVIHV
jgi:hypothetical protein